MNGGSVYSAFVEGVFVRDVLCLTSSATTEPNDIELRNANSQYAAGPQMSECVAPVCDARM